MQHLEVSGAVRPIYGSLGVKRLIGVEVITVTKTVALRITLSTRQKVILFLYFHKYFSIEEMF